MAGCEGVNALLKALKKIFWIPVVGVSGNCSNKAQEVLRTMRGFEQKQANLLLVSLPLCKVVKVAYDAQISIRKINPFNPPVVPFDGIHVTASLSSIWSMVRLSSKQCVAKPPYHFGREWFAPDRSNNLCKVSA